MICFQSSKPKIMKKPGRNQRGGDQVHNKIFIKPNCPLQSLIANISKQQLVTFYSENDLRPIFLLIRVSLIHFHGLDQES